MAHPLAVRLRSISRSLGLNRLVGLALTRSGYEVRLVEEMRNAIHRGDYVWDIGANVGWYTARFADWVGPNGHVFAFEPAPTNLARLRDVVVKSPNVTVIPMGLSDRDGDAAFLVGSDPTGASSRIVPDHLSEANAARVPLASGDSLVDRGEAPVPDVIKIDVEGHEFEVLKGIVRTLADIRPRAIFLEMHFALLEGQGRADIPAAIEELLRSQGFALRWIDISHLYAHR